MTRSSFVLPWLLLLAALPARAEDWEVTLGEGARELRPANVQLLTLQGDVLFVHGWTEGWTLDAGTGRVIATFAELPARGGQHPEVQVGDDVVVVRVGEEAKAYALRTGELVADLPGHRFEAAHGAVFALRRASPADVGTPTPARLERLSVSGTPAFSLELEPWLEAQFVWASAKGVVVTGGGGFVEVSPTGEQLRSWTLPSEEREALASDGLNVQVDDETVVVTLARPDATGKLLLFNGKRPREVPVAGLVGRVGLVPINFESARANQRDRETFTLRRPRVVERGRKRFAFIEVVPEQRPGLIGQLVGLHAVELGRGALGPRVTVEQPYYFFASGHAIQTRPGIIDVVTGQVAPQAGKGLGTRTIGSHWYHCERGQLLVGGLAGGAPRTLALPHEGASPSAGTFGDITDVLPFRGGGRTSGNAAPDAVVGWVDLKSGRVETLVQLPPAELAQMADHEQGEGALYFAVYCERGTERRPSYRVFRRDRRGR